MATALQNPPEESTVSLMGGIVDDFRELVQQELRLARKEITEDLRKTREAGLLWGGGVGLLGLSALTFCLMLANLLHSVTSPAGCDPAAIPMWGCYAIVTVLLVVPGFLVMAAGMKRLNSVNLLDKQLNRAMKEISNG